MSATSTMTVEQSSTSYGPALANDVFGSSDHVQDYDCFYASVVENDDPSLKKKPLAIQQKQIIVTCNYEARRRGLFKLQLISEARKVCPDVIIVLGEDLTLFRDASKELYNFIRGFSWNDRVERLGFDEVWMDVTDIVDYNIEVLNARTLSNSFFQLSKDDPTLGFDFNASKHALHVWPEEELPVPVAQPNSTDYQAHLRLMLGSHLAVYLREQVSSRKGYNATVGIASSKLLSKLVGNVHKPQSQTTLLPPQTNAMEFMDRHEIGAVPGIGFKLAQKLREHILGRPVSFNNGLVYGKSREFVAVKALRTCSTVTPDMLERLLTGPGSMHGIGQRTFDLIRGIDESAVAEARNIPRQISIEDSYIRLDTIQQVESELQALSQRLLERMRLDLTDTVIVEGGHGHQKWIGKPSSLRLTTRPRMPLQPDGTRVRSFKRISRSGPMPSFVLNLKEPVIIHGERLVRESLMTLFKRLHPEKSGWNLSLVNVAATDMVETASDSKAATGRDIQNMFENQASVLRAFQVYDESSDRMSDPATSSERATSESAHDQVPDHSTEPNEIDIEWESESESESDSGEKDAEGASFRCHLCGSTVPPFARMAHLRFHGDASYTKHDS